MKPHVPSLPEPGPQLESILVLRPRRAEGCHILREDERGLRVEWTTGARPFRFDLDPMGASVWKEIDGMKSLGELAEAFAARHHLRFFEAAALWIAYTRTLAQRNLVLFSAAKDSGEAG